MIVPNPSGIDLVSAVQGMKSYASLSVMLSAGLEPQKIAPVVLSALSGHVTGVALFLLLPDSGRLRLLSHAGEPADPQSTVEAAESRLLELLHSCAAGADVALDHDSPAGTGGQLVAVPFGNGAAVAARGVVLFCSPPAPPVDGFSRLFLHAVAQRVGDCLSTGHGNQEWAELPAQRDVTVLLVDDEPVMVAHIRRLLQRDGMQVHSAADARTAFDLARTIRPDVMIMDKVMPDMDGTELLRMVRRDDDIRTIPVIMLSGRADEAARVEALAAGADDFVVKPFNGKELVARLRANVNMVRWRRNAVWRDGELLRLAQSQQELRILLNTVQNVRDDERRVLAREVHDQLGQLLTAAAIDIGLLEQRLGDGPEGHSVGYVLGELRSALSNIHYAIASVQNIAMLLRPPALDEEGLIAAVRTQAADFQRRTGIACVVTENPGGQVEPVAFVAGELFRICQEGLTNVMRHANATRVTISLSRRADTLVLRIVDNGCGVTRAQVRAPTSIGIKGMRERASYVGATLRIRGAAGKGTVVAIRHKRAYA